MIMITIDNYHNAAGLNAYKDSSCHPVKFKHKFGYGSHLSLLIHLTTSRFTSANTFLVEQCSR